MQAWHLCGEVCRFSRRCHAGGAAAAVPRTFPASGPADVQCTYAVGWTAARLAVCSSVCGCPHEVRLKYGVLPADMAAALGPVLEVVVHGCSVSKLYI